MAKARSAVSRKKPLFGLDGSVTLAWYFKDEATAETTAVRESLAEAVAVVPALWAYEVANVLALGERRKRSTAADAAAWVAMLLALPIEVEPAAPALIRGPVLDLARTHGLSAYDASYLELAVRRDLPLATLDDKLLAAASKIGVRLYRPAP